MAAPVRQTPGAWSQTSGGSPATSIAVTAPANVAVGDLLELHLTIDTVSVTVTATGWTVSTGAPVVISSGGGNQANLVYYRWADASDVAISVPTPGTYSISFSANTFAEGNIQRVTGSVGSGSPYDTGTGAPVSSTSLSGFTTTTGVTLTTTGPDRLLTFAGTSVNSGAWTPPSGFTGSGSGGFNTVGVSMATQAVAGSTGTVQASKSTTDRKTAWLAAILPAGGDVVYTDTSGGGAASGSPDTLSRTFVDTSGGSAAAGSGDTLSLTYVDTSGGAAAGGSPDTLSRTFVDTSGGAAGSGSADVGDHVLVDTSGGSAGAGSSDALSRTFVDTSGGAASAGSGDALGAVYVDTSGGSAGGGSADTLSRVFVDTSGGAAGAGSADTLPTARIYTDTSGGAAGAGSPDPSATPTVKQDTMVMPILSQAVGCLEQEALLAPNPPQLYQVRPGTSAEPSADGYGTDECCQGLAVVTMVSAYESEDDNWLSPAGLPTNCPPTHWAVVLELKILRCVPLAADRRGGNVTTAQWLAAAQQQADDGATLRRALCCMRDVYGASSVAAGQVNPLPNEGGCGGVTLTLTVQAEACDCVG